MKRILRRNPCPSGHYGDATQECHCTPRQIQSYLSKISGPLLDRIDIHLEVAAVRPAALRGDKSGRSSDEMRAEVVTARAMQAKRFREGVRFVSSMTGRDLKTFCPLDAESEKLLTAAMEQMGLSARAHDKIIKVARTIADLDQSERIQGQHLAEAIQYRSLDRSCWA